MLVLRLFIMSKDWDFFYREANTPWDRAVPHPYLAQLRPRRDRRMRVLVPGCGRGHDAAALARIFSNAEVIAMDLSSTALAQAKLLEPPENVTFCHADLFHLGEEWNDSIDMVWEHTCFCAIQPAERIAYREVMRRLMKRGGFLVGAFFLTMNEDDEGGPPFNTSVEDFADVFDDGSGFCIRRMSLMNHTFSGREGEEWLVMMSRNDRSDEGRKAP